MELWWLHGSTNADAPRFQGALCSCSSRGPCHALGRVSSVLAPSPSSLPPSPLSLPPLTPHSLPPSFPLPRCALLHSSICLSLSCAQIPQWIDEQTRCDGESPGPSHPQGSLWHPKPGAILAIYRHSPFFAFLYQSMLSLDICMVHPEEYGQEASELQLQRTTGALLLCCALLLQVRHGVHGALHGDTGEQP